MARPDPIVLDPVRARPVRPRGSRGPQDERWYWRAEIGPHTVWTGWGTRDEVRQILAGQIASDRLGTTRPHLDGIRTVEDLLRRWLPALRRQRRRPRTVIAYEGGVKRLIDSPLGIVRLEGVSRYVLQTWADEAQDRYAPQTLSLDLQVLASAWRWGRGMGVFDRPLPEIDLGKIESVSDRYTPSLPEVRAVLCALDGQAPAWVKLLIEVQLATGARIGELADLTWDGVRADVGLLSLQGKTGRRQVPLPEHLLQRLEAGRARSRWVFGVRPASARGVGRYLRRACEAAGVRPWTTHALRRLAVDRLARAGVDVATAAALLGHSPTVMLQRYRQVSDADRRHAMATARLWDLGPPAPISAPESAPQDPPSAELGTPRRGAPTAPHKFLHKKNYNKV